MKAGETKTAKRAKKTKLLSFFVPFAFFASTSSIIRRIIGDNVF